MNQMLASPPALLGLCLRINDFEECKNIINFFNLDSPEAKEVSVCSCNVSHILTILLKGGTSRKASPAKED